MKRQWIEKIHALLSDAGHLRDFGEQAKQFTITNFAWKKMVEGYITVFKKYHYQLSLRGENVSSAGAARPGSGGAPSRQQFLKKNA